MSPGSAAILLDYLKHVEGTESDAETARRIGFARPYVCAIRCGRMAVSSGLILAIHEEFDIPVSEIRRLSGTEKS